MKPEMKGQSTLPFDTWVLLLGTGLVKRMSLPGQVTEALPLCSCPGTCARECGAAD